VIPSFRACWLNDKRRLVNCSSKKSGKRNSYSSPLAHMGVASLNAAYTFVYVMSRVIPARLPPDLARGIDRLVKSGRFANRSEVIKEATRLLLSSGDTPPPSSMARSAARLVSLIVAWNTPSLEAVVLFGSLARSEFTPESDIDILVLISRGSAWKIRRALYNQIYPVIAGLGLDISLIVVDRETWQSMVKQGDPLAVSIRQEGVVLWGSLEHPA